MEDKIENDIYDENTLNQVEVLKHGHDAYSVMVISGVDDKHYYTQYRGDEYDARQSECYVSDDSVVLLCLAFPLHQGFSDFLNDALWGLLNKIHVPTENNCFNSANTMIFWQNVIQLQR